MSGSEFPNPRAVLGPDGEGVLIGHPVQPQVLLRRKGPGELTITLRVKGKTLGSGVLTEQPDKTLRGTCSELDAVWQVSGKWNALEFRG